MLGPDQVEDRAQQIGVGDDRPGLIVPAVDRRRRRRGRSARRGFSRRSPRMRTSTPLCSNSSCHQPDQPVGAALEGVHALGHEVREHDAVAQGRVFQRRAVGVGDRLHQQPDTSPRPGKNRSNNWPPWSGLVVVEVHVPRGVEERRRRVSAGTWNRSTSSRVKSWRSKVVESENIGLSKRMSFNCTIESAISRAPIAAAALDHADRKAVQRDVEDVPAAAAEPGGQPAQLVVLLGQQHAVAGPGQGVGGGHAAQAAADDDDVVVVAEVLRRVGGHRDAGLSLRRTKFNGNGQDFDP